MSELTNITIEEAHDGLKKGKFTSVQLVQAALDRIKEVNAKLNAFTSINKEYALRRAAQADEDIQKGNITHLTGIPYAVKNNYASFDQSTKASSKFLEEYKTPYSGTIIKKLNKAGAILIGKTNCDPYGFGISTKNSGYGPSHNPWDINKTPGGSSGGLGAAIATGCAVFGLGEDTGGSVRNPGSLCGVTALKPTYGLLSRYGIFAMACSFDCPGPMALTSADIATILKYIVGKDPKDSQTIQPAKKDYKVDPKQLSKFNKIGFPKQFMTDDIEKGTKEKVTESMDFFRDKGIEVVELDMPDLKYAIEVYYVLVPGEISSNQALYDGVRFARTVEGQDFYQKVYYDNKTKGFEEEVKRRIMIGTFALSRESYKLYYEKAAKVRTLVIQEYQKAFEKVDLIVHPVTPRVAWDLDEEMDPVTAYLLDVFTVAASCAGLPSISIPVGLSTNLPVGLHVTAPSNKDHQLLSFSAAYQAETDWHKQHPQI
jgi:aspartyl-tRNA(Asn)/glutamyl-tRNA(Gln) amidotransferase subunit A